MGLYSFLSALVRTWPLLPYGTSPPKKDEMKRRGGTVSFGFFGLDGDCGGSTGGHGDLRSSLRSEKEMKCIISHSIVWDYFYMFKYLTNSNLTYSEL